MEPAPPYPIVTEVKMRSQNDVKKTFPYDIVLKDSLGRMYSSSSVLPTKKKPLVLFFWMTTCGPCRQELEAIKAKYADWKKEADFRMIAISLDFPDYYNNFIERVKKEGWQFEALFDVTREFPAVMPYGGLNGLPQVFVLDAKGEPTYHHRRYVPGDENELFEAIKKQK
ncbi:MAG: TlpA disulfide reductase family protein [Saprospiraceae bacterium]|nr:TlpA disulfide reductase family protein [Saprospiraceae bacterium]